MPVVPKGVWPPPSDPGKPPTSELLALWTGDGDSDGYQTVALGVELCRRLKPTSLINLAGRVRPGYPENVHVDEQGMLEQAYKLWSELG